MNHLIALSFTLLLFSLQLGYSHGQSCAKIQLIDECACEQENVNRVSISCRGLKQASQVQAALSASKDCWSLIIEDSILPSFPLDLGSHNIRMLHIKNSVMPYISPPNEPSRSAFENLKHLSVIKIESVMEVAKWDWTKLRNLPNLTYLSVNRGSLVHVPKSFSSIGGSKLETVSFVNCGLETIAEGGLAIASLRKLEIIENPIEELETTMFSKDTGIEDIELRGLSKINIDVDVFNTMKKLKRLTLDTTVLANLTEKHFLNSNLESLRIYADFNAPKLMTCDCAHKWILNLKPINLGICGDNRNIPYDLNDYLQSC